MSKKSLTQANPKKSKTTHKTTKPKSTSQKSSKTITSSSAKKPALPKTQKTKKTALSPTKKTALSKSKKTALPKSKKTALPETQKTKKPALSPTKKTALSKSKKSALSPKPALSPKAVTHKPALSQTMIPKSPALISKAAKPKTPSSKSAPSKSQEAVFPSQPQSIEVEPGEPGEIFESSEPEIPINPETVMYYQDLMPGEPKKSAFWGTQLTNYVQKPYVQEYIQKHSKAKLYIGQKPVIPRAKKISGWNDDVPYILSRESDAALPSCTFVGRQEMFEALQAQRTIARHTALIGMRKMGKTAFVKRYYDYLFTTSESVIPFFYSFMNLDERRGSKKSVVQVAEEMMIVFLSQALGFLTQNKTLANNNEFDNLLFALENLPSEAKEMYYEIFHQMIQSWYADGTLRPLYQMMQRSIDITLRIKFFFDLSPVIMLDEYQEVARSFVDENGESYDCVPVLNKYHCNDRIFLLLSGSGLTTRMEDALPPAFEYRIERVQFGSLEKEDSQELVRRTVQALNLNVFEGIEEKLYKLVDGNPYFIQSVLTHNSAYQKMYGEKKDFTKLAGLLKAYRFECTDEAGKIYDFWHWYLIRNWQAYPAFLKFGQAVYQILRFLVNAKQAVPLQTIQDMMKQELQGQKDALTIERLVARILIHLGRIDLIKWKSASNMIFIAKEPTIVASIQAIKYDLFYPEDPQELHREENMEQHILDIYKTRESLEELATQVKKMQENVDTIHKDLKKVKQAGTGKVSHEQGKDAEAEVRGMIQRREGIFAPYPILGNVRNEKIQDPSSKLEYELDCVADIDPVQLPLKDIPMAKISYVGIAQARGSAGSAHQKSITIASLDQEPTSKAMLVVEVKDQKKKTDISQALHFIQSLEALQRMHSLTQVYAVFYSCSGFYKNAMQELIKRHVVVAECDRSKEHACT